VVAISCGTHRSAQACQGPRPSRRDGPVPLAQKPASDSRPLYADRHLPSHQASDRLIPEEFIPLVLTVPILLRAFRQRVHFRSSFGYSPAQGSCPEPLLQRLSPWLFATVAWSGLGPAPESRSRGAYPHVSSGFTASLCLTSFHSASAQHTRTPQLPPVSIASQPVRSNYPPSPSLAPSRLRRNGHHANWIIRRSGHAMRCKRRET
jgi:hypothetical protein